MDGPADRPRLLSLRNIHYNKPTSRLKPYKDNQLISADFTLNSGDGNPSFRA
jgi:hypothetical protein